MTVFDDAWLDHERALAGAEPALRRVAEAGSRLRRETEAAEQPKQQLAGIARPRAVVAVGSEARFIRAMLEPVCPVPFVAWPHHGLPGWVGALDLVVAMASDGAESGVIMSVAEATRRGSLSLVASPASSAVADQTSSRSTTLLPTMTADPLAAAIVVLDALHLAQLGPQVRPDLVADAMDLVAEECSPYRDLADNPAKDLALGLADAHPLVWGGSVLAARASRRIAEAIRAGTGRAALAADAGELLPILGGAVPRDPFADPFTDEASADRRPGLLILDDGNEDALIRSAHTELVATAERNDVRASTIGHRGGSDVERYVTLLQTGRFAAVYLAVGLGRHHEGQP